MSWSELARALAGAAAAGLVSACAGAGAAPPPPAAGVCPLRAGAAPTQIDVYDGDPSEQAILAPDDSAGAGANTYTVQQVYAAGRIVTIRCHYGRDVVDVPLPRPVAACRFSGDERRPQVACR
jgi:hypothetical protein